VDAECLGGAAQRCRAASAPRAAAAAAADSHSGSVALAEPGDEPAGAAQACENRRVAQGVRRVWAGACEGCEASAALLPDLPQDPPKLLIRDRARKAGTTPFGKLRGLALASRVSVLGRRITPMCCAVKESTRVLQREHLRVRRSEEGCQHLQCLPSVCD
jgi:hypothetical protein